MEIEFCALEEGSQLRNGIGKVECDNNAQLVTMQADKMGQDGRSGVKNTCRKTTVFDPCVNKVRSGERL